MELPDQGGRPVVVSVLAAGLAGNHKHCQGRGGGVRGVWAGGKAGAKAKARSGKSVK